MAFARAVSKGGTARLFMTVSVTSRARADGHAGHLSLASEASVDARAAV